MFESSNSSSSDEDYDPAEQANMFQMVKLGAMGRSRYERLVARQDPASWSKNKDTANNASWKQWRESTNWKWGSDKKEKEKNKEDQEKKPASASTDNWLSGRMTQTRMTRPWTGWRKCFSCGKTNFAPGWGCMNPHCQRNYDQQWIEYQAKNKIEEMPEDEDGKPEEEANEEKDEKEKDEKAAGFVQPASKAKPTAPAVPAAAEAADESADVAAAQAAAANEEEKFDEEAEEEEVPPPEPEACVTTHPFGYKKRRVSAKKGDPARKGK